MSKNKTMNKKSVKKPKPLHKQLAEKIKECGINKTNVFKSIGISKYNLNKYLKMGLIADVGRNRFKDSSHDLTPEQKKIIRTKFLNG